ncbi:hypothetical protein [Bacillus sp. MUM 13]|uniref:hypothetical protein n=1 Tax=Bacillus sp. MUM 13 TaxID=1678001 RepID=UPI0008F5CE2E|nr:hypothetical protein [Bacillus sp. MUM 13]OIK08819.1 hypothetical protein BIV59_18720 [Bacillus sp. MUM 13]
MEFSESKTAMIYERILPKEDLTCKVKIFQALTDEMAKIDHTLEKKIENISVEDKATGEIIHAILEKSKEQMAQHLALLENIDDQMAKLISSYDQQVDSMKSQSMTFQYLEEEFGTLTLPLSSPPPIPGRTPPFK